MQHKETDRTLVRIQVSSESFSLRNKRVASRPLIKDVHSGILSDNKTSYHRHTGFTALLEVSYNRHILFNTTPSPNPLMEVLATFIYFTGNVFTLSLIMGLPFAH